MDHFRRGARALILCKVRCLKTMKAQNQMQEAEKVLAEKSVRITPMRLLVLEALIKQKGSVGLSEMEQLLPRSDRVTIYRTLKTFSQNGIVHPIESGTTEVKYALCSAFCSANEHFDKHPHFHCRKCDQIICLETAEISSLQIPSGYQAEEITMIVKGVCASCNKLTFQI